MRIINYLMSKVGDLTKKFSNLPESYIERSYKQVYWRTPRGYPQYLNKEISRKKNRFSIARPWTQQFRDKNSHGKLHKKVFVEPIEHWSIFRGDRVEILVGKDKGKQGIVSQVIEERNWVIVEGLNTILKCIGKEKNYAGAYVKWELPLLVTTQVKLVDPETLSGTDVEWRFTEEGDEVRVSKATGRIIPIPKQAHETIDYKTKSAYVENEAKDTVSAVISEITFKPELKTFEMDIMEKMGIKEDRTPAKTYWY